MGSDLEQLVSSAVSAYLEDPSRHGPPAGGTISVGHALDCAMGLAHRWDEPGLAGCLLVLALARRRQGGMETCARALRHALAELEISLPVPAVDLDSARDLCARLEACDVHLDLAEIMQLRPSQVVEAQLWTQHYLVWHRKRPYRIDMPEMPRFLKDMKGG